MDDDDAKEKGLPLDRATLLLGLGLPVFYLVLLLALFLMQLPNKAPASDGDNVSVLVSLLGLILVAATVLVLTARISLGQPLASMLVGMLWVGGSIVLLGGLFTTALDMSFLTINQAHPDKLASQSLGSRLWILILVILAPTPLLSAGALFRRAYRYTIAVRANQPGMPIVLRAAFGGLLMAVIACVAANNTQLV